MDDHDVLARGGAGGDDAQERLLSSSSPSSPSSPSSSSVIESDGTVRLLPFLRQAGRLLAAGGLDPRKGRGVPWSALLANVGLQVVA
jgi:hypothetical protein